MAKIIDGRQISKDIRAELAGDVAEFIQNNAVAPCLAAVMVGENAASEVYVRNKRRACDKVGIDSQLHRLPSDATQDELLGLIGKLNRDPAVHGVLVQLPLPPQIDADGVLLAVSPVKDVDAFHPENVGLMVQCRPRFLPCTPHGVVELLVRSGVPVAGRHAVVIGRSQIVGRSLSILLSQAATEETHAGDATVTLCHSRTPDLAEHTRRADIVVPAVGQPGLLTGDMVKPGAAVIDVGINHTEDGSLAGDADFDSVAERAGWITPVPGGVGPMNITMLLVNTLAAARLQEAGGAGA